MMRSSDTSGPARTAATATVLLAALLLAGLPTAASATQAEATADNEELRQMHADDQADRRPPDGETIDWSVVGPRDSARLARVKELFAADSLRTANDYYRAAMILQHGSVPEDYLLAHEFCVVAIIKGKNDKAARWLAAASEDRFLMSLERPQRFATQFRSSGGGPVRLYQVDPTVTDELRRLMDARSLEEAEAQEAEFNE